MDKPKRKNKWTLPDRHATLRMQSVRATNCAKRPIVDADIAGHGRVDGVEVQFDIIESRKFRGKYRSMVVDGCLRPGDVLWNIRSPSPGGHRARSCRFKIPIKVLPDGRDVKPSWEKCSE